MADSYCMPQVRKSALSDPQLSPQAVALAAAKISGGSVEGLCFSQATTDLARWELHRTGHIGGAA